MGTSGQHDSLAHLAAVTSYTSAAVERDEGRLPSLILWWNISGGEKKELLSVFQCYHKIVQIQIPKKKIVMTV